MKKGYVVIGIVNWSFIFKKVFICLFERESIHTRTGGRAEGEADSR